MIMMMVNIEGHDIYYDFKQYNILMVNLNHLLNAFFMLLSKSNSMLYIVVESTRNNATI